MFAKVARIITTALAVASVTVTLQAPAQAQVLKSSFINAGERTLVPFGWLEFCNRYQGECVSTSSPVRDIDLTAANYRRIAQVNRWVNSSITARSDQEQWGVVDRWDYPSSGFGDCEDYVLLKRRLLVQEGFPASALLVTVVRDERGDGHAVLTVKTNRGEFVLDNLREGVRPWTESPYRFVKRQSQQDPNLWVDIGDFATGPRVASR
jgi:predicted transglutaminase-like cysteine proteinase